MDIARLSPVLLLPLIVSIGFIASRVGWIDREHAGILPQIIVNIAYPAMILTSVTSVDIRLLTTESVIVIVATLVITFALYGLGVVALRRYGNAQRRPIIVLALTVGNIAYMALPIIRMLFGEAGVYYAMLHSAAQDLAIWTVCYAYFAGGGTFSGFKLRKMVSPAFVMLALGIVLSLAGIELGGVVEETLVMISKMTTPIALLYVGCIIAGKDYKWKLDRDSVLVALTKVILIPIVVFCVLRLCRVPNHLTWMLTIMFGSPVTVLGTVWAQQFNLDMSFAIRSSVLLIVLFLTVACAGVVVYSSFF